MNLNNAKCIYSKLMISVLMTQVTVKGVDYIFLSALKRNK